MKLRLLAAIALALATLCAARADSYSFKEPFTKTGSFSPTGTLSVQNVNGQVNVRTWDKNEIRIEGEKSAKTEEELGMIDLTMDVSDTRAALKVKLPKRQGGWFGGGNIRASVRFEITVPATARLEAVETVNSAVEIDGIRGPVNAETVNGSVRATNLGGDAKLETVNGSVEADFATVSANHDLSFETVNGRIRVRLPGDAGFRLHAETVNGHVDCDFPIQLTKSGRRTLQGTVGDGRAQLRAECVNGSVSIEQR